MENLTHSQHLNMLSKKPFTNPTKTLYDDVFGGPPRFGAAPTLSPRVEDYTEIFGGFHAPRGPSSSIPLLDLSLVENEVPEEVFVDVRSCSGFDYDEVFSGFSESDFAVFFEELMMEQSKGPDFSSDEAWTPEDPEYLSEESDPSAKNQCFSNDDSHESADGSMEFNISYHKASQSSGKDMANGITHVTQLVDVPGYAFIVDKTMSLSKTDDNYPPLQVSDDGHLNIDFTGDMTGGKKLQKTMSHLANCSTDGPGFGNEVRPHREYVRNGSLPNQAFVTISDVSLKTCPSHLPPPSRPPPPLGVKRRDSSKTSPNCASVASSGSVGDGSPPYFDVEVDASSSAAASAAAMKEAMEKAQVKLKSAKQLMERKRDGFQSHTKSGLKNDRKDREGRGVKIVDVSGSTKYEGLQGFSETEENAMDSFVLEEMQRVTIPDSFESKRHLHATKQSSDEKHGRESLSSQGSDKIEEAGEWKEATQFFELVRTNVPRKVIDLTNNGNFLLPNTIKREQGQKVKKAAMEAFQQQLENGKKVKPITVHELEGYEKKPKLPKQACDQWGNNGRSEEAANDFEKKLQVAQEAFRKEDEKRFRMDKQFLETEKKQTRANGSKKREYLVEVARTQGKLEGKQTMENEKKEPQPKEAIRIVENEKRFTHKKEVGESRQRNTFELVENEEKLKALEQMEHERRLKEVFELEEKEKRIKEARMREERQKQREACVKEEEVKRLRTALEQEENERRLKEAFVKENEGRIKDVLEREEYERRQREVYEREENEKRQRRALEKEESERLLEENEKRRKEAHEREEQVVEDVGIEETTEGEAAVQLEETNEQVETWKLREALEDEEHELGACQSEAIEDESQEPHNQEDFEMKPKDEKDKLEVLNEMGDNFRVLNQAHKPEVNKNPGSKRSTDRCEGKNRKQEMTGELTREETGKIPLKLKIGNKEPMFQTVSLQGDRKIKGFGMVLDNLEHEYNQSIVEDAAVSVWSDERMMRAGEAEQITETVKEVSRMESDFANRGKEFAQDRGERRNIPRECIVNQEDRKGNFVPIGAVKKSVESGRKTAAVQPTNLEVKGNILGDASESKKNLNKGLASQEKEVEKMRREKELEMECLRKLEEEREREREREKDRMAVDRAALEASERGHNEARERAERAAVERAMNEARERLERACAEAREKSLADNRTSMEARFRECAAVEKATAEARERAFVKVMSEKTAFEARERLERSVSDKLSASSRNGGMGTSSSSSVYNGSNYMERSEVEGESPQRCKARLERHRRTAERAAKALAEKNMRDLLAQREQAERNRLAEALGADVKRWSTGKEGNLRALLSTLQYILGADSGWQPIPLTEVITSAAVKKAYRKATLCVHPDKLQQRGASIQQKYICEKVFDLLKEAWNKFNSEER